MISTLLVAAALLDPLGILVHRLHPGLDPAQRGGRCAGSFAALGESVGGGPPSRTTVVDTWYVRRENEPLGWILKTVNGSYWYEMPDGSYFEQITAVNADELAERGIAIGGCFRRDLVP